MYSPLEKITTVSPYRYVSCPSNKLRIFSNHYEAPCYSIFTNLWRYPSTTIHQIPFLVKYLAIMGYIHFNIVDNEKAGDVMGLAQPKLEIVMIIDLISV